MSDCWNKLKRVHVVAARPLDSRTALLHNNMRNCKRMMMAKIITGRTTSGIVAFERTVVRSETGSDFQNRMLRSRRSLCSAERQEKTPTMKAVKIDTSAA